MTPQSLPADVYSRPDYITAPDTSASDSHVPPSTLPNDVPDSQSVKYVANGSTPTDIVNGPSCVQDPPSSPVPTKSLLPTSTVVPQDISTSPTDDSLISTDVAQPIQQL